MTNAAKMFSVFVLVCLFLVPSAVVSVYAIVVAPNECPQSTQSVHSSCTSLTYECIRTDSGVISVSGGTPDTVTSESFNCNNCGTACPDVVPPSMHCKGTLSIIYTETVTASVAAGVSSSMGVGAGGVSATVSGTLESSIGHSSARSKTFSLECGTSSLPGCEKASYAMQLAIMTGVTTKMEHEYKWEMTLTHNSSGCTVPEHSSESYPQITYDFSGTRTSTATGSSYGSAACFCVSSSPCP